MPRLGAVGRRWRDGASLPRAARAGRSGNAGRRGPIADRRRGAAATHRAFARTRGPNACGRARRPHYEAGVRLLVLARHDLGGAWCHLSTVLRQQGVVDARVVTFAHDPATGWPVDIADVFDGGQELEHLLLDADAYHLVDLLPGDVTLFDGVVGRRCAQGRVQVSLQLDARPSAAVAREVEQLAGQHGWPVVSTRPNTVPSAEFIAPFIPVWRAQWQPVCAGTRDRTRNGERVVIASCDGRLRDEARLETLVDRAEAAASRLADVRVEVLEGRPHPLVLQRQRRSHLALHGDDGIGRASLESLAQGVATVAELSAADHEAWTRLAGAPPPVIAPHDLEAVIAELPYVAEDPARRRWAEAAASPRRWIDRSRAWWRSGSSRRAA